MSEPKTCFKKVDYELSGLLHYVDIGDMREKVTTAEYQEALGVPNRTAKNHIMKLTELGLLRMKGAGPATYYEVVRP